MLDLCLQEKMLANEAMLSNYRTIQEENRRLYNQVQDLQGNIRVFCRCAPRPPHFVCGQGPCRHTNVHAAASGWPPSRCTADDSAHYSTAEYSTGIAQLTTHS
jgi:hypothetical protein